MFAAERHDTDKSDSVRILIIDDNTDITFSLAKLLEIAGNEVLVAHNGNDAIKAAKRFFPEIILLDIGLPDQSGYEVAKKLRKTRACKKALIIAVSGYLPDLKEQENGALFDQYLLKPPKLNELKQIIKKYRSGK